MIRSIILSTLLFGGLWAQDDLLELIQDDSDVSTPIWGTFKATRIVNAQSIEMPKPRILEFMILHRFGSMSDGFYDLFGMDEAVIRFDLKYGLNDHISLGAGRSSLNKTFDLFSKIRFLRQTKGQGSMPISIALFTKLEMQTITRDMDMPDRLTFDVQALIARKFNRSFSLQIMPTYIHRNLVLTQNEKHELISFGIGGRMKLSKRTSINFDTFFPIGDRQDSYVQSWGMGYDIETGGHVFQLMVTNAQGSFESEYVERARGQLEDLDLYIGFNIARVFSL